MILKFQMGQSSWDLAPPGGKLGRNQGLAVTIPDQTVSGEHAEFTWDAAADSWWIRPLRANNPVFLNGVELPMARLKLPASGELIFGRVAVQFRSAASSSSAKPVMPAIPIKPGTQVPEGAQPLRAPDFVPSLGAPGKVPRTEAPPTQLGNAPPSYLAGSEEPSMQKKADPPASPNKDGVNDVQRKLQSSARTHARMAQLAQQLGGVSAALTILCILGWLLGVRLAGQ